MEPENETSSQTVNIVMLKEKLNLDTLGPIVSDEEYECSIINYTALGRTILPGSEIYAPVEASTIKIKDNTINVGEVKIISETPEENLGEGHNVVELEYKLIFQLQFLDKDLNILSINCETSAYPMPGDKVIIKDYLAAAISFRRKLVVDGAADTAEAKARLIEIHGRYIKEKKHLSYYDINNEPYLKINIIIKLYTSIKVNLLSADIHCLDIREEDSPKPKISALRRLINKFREWPKSKKIIASIITLIVISNLGNSSCEDLQ
jgi:hypothetical protein